VQDQKPHVSITVNLYSQRTFSSHRAMPLQEYWVRI